jgi:hypothetical protein
MKIFWILIGIIALVTAGMFIMPTKTATPVTPTSLGAPINNASEQPEAQQPADIDNAHVETLAAEPAPTPDPAVEMAAQPAPKPDTTPLLDVEPEPTATQSPVAASDPATGVVVPKEPRLSPEALAWLATTFGDGDASSGTTDVTKPGTISDNTNAASPATAEPAIDVVSTAQVGPPLPSALPAPSVQIPSAPAEPKVAIDHVEHRADGTIRVGDRWTIKGEGTADSPYVVEWQMLQSAGRIYQPQQGREELPAWAELIGGKRIKLTGYTMLPMTGETQNQMLVMLNQWDGCCIGVPPTPYDAAEVTLSKSLAPSAAAIGHQGSSLYGDIEGTLKIDPYIVRGWLLGLYVIEDGVFTAIGG